MRKSLKKSMSVLLATSVLASPIVVLPHAAYALEIDDVSADDTDTDEETEYTIEFTIEKALSSGDEIIVKFPSGYEVDKKLKVKDVTLEDDDDDEIDIDDVSVSGRTVTIELGEKISKNTSLILTIDGITNPGSKGDYKISVETTNEKSVSEKISIGKSSSKSSSSSRFDVSLGKNTAGDTTSVSLGKFNLSSKLVKGKYIYVTMPSRDMLPKEIDRSDVKVNGERAQKVTLSGSSTIRIEVPSGADGDKTLKLDFSSSAGIVNPSSSGKSYTYEIEYDNKTYRSETFEIKESSSSSSSSNFDVSLSDKSAGARTSYTFDLDLSSKLYANTDIQVEFPSIEMVPPVISSYNVTVNGQQVSNISVNGNRVSFRTPSGFTSSNSLTIKFSQDAYLINPRTAGTYEMTIKVDGKTYRSKKFDVGGSSAVTPVQVDNTTATIALTRATASTPAGLQVGIKGLGVPLAKGRDFVEIVMPAGFRVPAYVAPNTVTVNGMAANYVGVRGQNLIIYPSQDIPARTAVQVNVTEAASIVNPATTGVYSISVFTSEEQGLLFARPINIVALNGVSFKANVASYTKGGKTFALTAAPYTVNGHTLMPASFYKDGLGLSTTWNNSTARIVSGNTTMQFKVGSNIATVNGQNITLPVAVQLKNNIPVIPLRFVMDRTGYNIIYVNGNYTVYK